jgi:hypothetical protein
MCFPLAGGQWKKGILKIFFICVSRLREGSGKVDFQVSFICFRSREASEKGRAMNPGQL